MKILKIEDCQTAASALSLAGVQVTEEKIADAYGLGDYCPKDDGGAPVANTLRNLVKREIWRFTVHVDHLPEKGDRQTLYTPENVRDISWDIMSSQDRVAQMGDRNLADYYASEDAAAARLFGPASFISAAHANAALRVLCERLPEPA
jgi:hypothetical protein